MTLRFTKMHGAGNDFVVLDLRADTAEPGAALCRALADRHTGVGCDQILTVERAADGAAARYRIWNADGSSSQQCGNGARCIAAWIVRDAQARGEALGDEFVLDSPVGAHAVTRLEGGRYRIEMGLPRFAPNSIPLHGFEGAQDEYVLYHNDAVFTFGAVSMGNPHAVIQVSSVRAAPVDTLGPAVENHSRFPRRTNVGFMEVVSPEHIRLRVYERGAGETQACGTGACGAVAVGRRLGLLQERVQVDAPGGSMTVRWAGPGKSLWLTGPAVSVFEGSIDI